MPPIDTADMEAIVANMTLVDWLDDLTVRFLLNLPPAELSSVPRLCFQVEEAQWFYEDFIRPANPTLPSLNLRQFCLTLFQHCPLLSGFNAAQHLAAYEEFLAYKVRVPVRGAILMDDSMEKVLLVRGWKKGASWSFPRGKINKNEPDLDCAIREVYEETGYDVSAANLVDVNRQLDGEVKAIDVIMREQHMKLFVFRGVPLDTYFEPRTRKEISKIQWYNIKDLPGFKKQKGLAGQGSGEAQTTKFYMVAPFLGHLKKFINLQKRNGATNVQGHVQHGRSTSGVNDGYQTGVTDTDDGDALGGAFTGNAHQTNERSADELKRLLSIGQPPGPQQAQPAFGEPRNDLLAMLQGGKQSDPVMMNFDPRTPFDQIDNPFPTQTPQTPQPQHPHHSQNRVADIRQNPQLGFSPQHMQQFQEPQRNSSLPMQGGFGGHMHGQHSQQHQNHLPPHVQQQLFHQEQQRQHSLPNYPLAPPQHLQQQQQQQQRPDLRPSSQQQMSLLQAFHGPGRPQPPMTSNNRPVSRGVPPIGSEPSVPEASNLPAPRLNAHSVSLLDAFKGSNGSKNTSSNQASSSNRSMESVGGEFAVHEVAYLLHETNNKAGQADRRAGSQQQSTLLDLFKKPSDSQPSTLIPELTEAAAIPRVSSPALSDVTVKGRKSSANEITRTLPVKMKAKAPVPKPAQKTNQSQEDSTVRQGSNGRSQVPSNSRNHKGSPKPKGRPEPPQVPQFSILQRPTSSAGKAPLPPQSPLRFEAPQPSQPTPFQPQVLKRPTSADASEVVEKPALHTPEVQPQVQAQPQRNSSLLDLLNGRNTSPVIKTPSEVVEEPAVSTPEAPQTQSQTQRNSSLLDLLNGRGTPPVIKTPEPPPAPQLVPERKVSQHGALPVGNHQKQQNLLNLFTKSGPYQHGGSPGTPISPFTLGTPAASKPRESSFSEQSSEASRSRLGSIASVRSGMSSGQQTPTEAKDFMLGYLNGVVQKEGYRGKKT